MGQQPNIPIDQRDAPRSKPSPGPARAWKPSRPGDLVTPEQVPSGGAFGVIGPDSGYALRLATEYELNLLPGEHKHDLEVAVAAIASARAAGFGRAPIADDVAVAMIVLGLDREAAVDPGVLSNRPRWVANAGHDAGKLRGIVADVPADLLALTPAQLRARVADGWVYRNGGAAE